MRAIIAFALVTSALLAACSMDLSAARGASGGKDTNGGGLPGEEGSSADPTQPGGCQEGVAHTGFASSDLIVDRKVGGIGIDRRRVKPYSALKSEFQRALGNVPSGLAGSAAAFGDVPARWYSEPTAGAVSLYTTYTLAFTACYDTMTDTKYGQMPTPETAAAECTALQRKIWQRSPTPDETTACADYAVGLADETVARRRWAHACASIMSSAGFTTY